MCSIVIYAWPQPLAIVCLHLTVYTGELANFLLPISTPGWFGRIRMMRV